MKKNIITQKVAKSFTNAFAENVYELENGIKIYISYGGDIVNIEMPMEEK